MFVTLKPSSPCFPFLHGANTKLVVGKNPRQDKPSSLSLLDCSFLGVYKSTFWVRQWEKAMHEFWEIWGSPQSMNLEGLWYKTGAKHLTCGSEVNCPEFLASRLTMAFFQLSELSRSRKLQWDEIHVHSQYRQHILKEKSRLISKSSRSPHSYLGQILQGIYPGVNF